MKYNLNIEVYNSSTASMLRSARVLMLNHSPDNQSQCGDLPDMINFVLDTVMHEVLQVQSGMQPGHQERKLAAPTAEEVLLSNISRIHNLIALYRTAGSTEEQTNTGFAIWNSFEQVLTTYTGLLTVEGFTSSREGRQLYACSRG